MSGATGIYKCACCGAPFTARKADRARGWAKFCSKRCKAIKQEARTGQYRDYKNYQQGYGGEVLAPHHSQDGDS